MTKKTAHYLPDGKVYKGPVHKIGDRVMTGATHTAASVNLKHTPTKKAKK